MAGALCVLGLLALIGGYAGALHPLGDSLSVLRLPAAVALLVFGLIALGLRARVLGGLAAGAAMLSLGGMTRTVLPTDGLTHRPTDTALILYTKNLSFRLTDPGPVLGDIAATGASLLTLQELSATNGGAMDRLGPVWMARHRCVFTAGLDVGVAARWPVAPGGTRCAHGMAAVHLQGPDGPFWLVSLHLHWPWPYRQPEQLSRLLPALAALAATGDPLVIGGDFNAMPWSSAVDAVARASATRRLGPAHRSFEIAGMYVLPIDHVLAAGQGRVTRRPLFGSDHAGLLARVDLTADAE
ncbi:MAG: endonuclease/exonuclease/phosphatase family protein [Pseudomonadota bacterium]